MFHLSGTIPICGYDSTATNYIAVAAEAAAYGGNPVPVLIYMLNNTSLYDLLSPATMQWDNTNGHDPHVLGNLVRVGNRALEETWIDRVYDMVVAPPAGVAAQAMPLTSLHLTLRSSGSSNAMTHLSFARYLKAFQFGLVFANVDDITPGHARYNTWSVVIGHRVPSPDHTSIVTHMALVSTTINDKIGVPINLAGRHEMPRITSGEATPHFLAIWYNERWLVTLIANGTHRVSETLSEVTTLIPGTERLAGWAAIQHFNADGLAMLSEWIDLARPRLTQNQLYEELTDILWLVVEQYGREFVNIMRQYHQAPNALPAGGNAAVIEQRKEDLLDEIEATGIEMIRNVMEDSIAFTVLADVTLNPNWVNLNMKLADTTEFIEFLRCTIEPLRASGTRDQTIMISRPMVNEILKYAARRTRSRG